MSEPPPPRGAPRAPAALAVLATVLLAGCTVVQPVPESAQSGRISPQLASTGATATAPARLACEDTGPAYAGGLADAICEIDRRRLQYLRLGADVLNTQATWNAALWPLSAAALYEAARGGGARSLLLPTAALGAGYGVLASGIPERQAQYLAAARRLGCLVVAASADLYRQSDIQPLPGAEPVGDGVRPLAQATAALSQSLLAYEHARLVLLAGLRSRPAPGTPQASFTDAVSARHRGASAGSSGADSRLQVQAETLALQQRAEAVLQAGLGLQWRLLAGEAGWQLRMQAAAVDADLQADLARRAPALATPGSVSAALAQAGVGTLESGPRGDPVLTPQALAGLHAQSLPDVQRFQAGPAAALAAAVREVAGWSTRHEAQRAAVQRLATGQGCTGVLPAGTAPVATPPDGAGLPSATDAAGRRERPATSSTTGTGQVRSLVP